MVLKAAFLQRTVAQWEEAFHDANALFGPVLTLPQVLAHPQMAALDMIQSVEHSRIGSIPQLAAPIFMSDTPARIRRAPPMLGEHTAEILQEVGYSQAEIERFAERKVVFAHGL